MTETCGRNRESGERHEIRAIEILASYAERVAQAKDLGNARESQGTVVEKDPEKLHLTQGCGDLLTTFGTGQEYRKGLLVRGSSGALDQ